MVYTTRTEGRARNADGRLVGYRGRLFRVCYEVGEHLPGFSFSNSHSCGGWCSEVSSRYKWPHGLGSASTVLLLSLLPLPHVVTPTFDRRHKRAQESPYAQGQWSPSQTPSPQSPQ
ncbi:hypothetical protein BDW66DRAFT_128595 [Aspergillus desertorum]